MTKVYVTCDTPFDFSEAERFGDLEFVTHSDIHNPKGSPHNAELLRQIREKIKAYDPDEDFILPVGSPYVQGCVFMALGLRGIREVRVLRWSNRDRLYIPVHLQFDRG